jgi:hypothetical protein
MTINDVTMKSGMDVTEPIFLQVSIWRVSQEEPTAPATRYSANYNFSLNLETMAHLDSQEVLSAMHIPPALFLTSGRYMPNFKYYMMFVASKLPIQQRLWKESLEAYESGKLPESVWAAIRSAMNSSKPALSRRPFAAGRVGVPEKNAVVRVSESE